MMIASWVARYGWNALLTPELIVVVSVMALLYANAGNEQPDDAGGYTKLHWKRQAAFYAGLFVMYFSYGSFLSALSNESIDYYVFQLCLRYMVMLPLLIIGTPDWIRDRFIDRFLGGLNFFHQKQLGFYAMCILFVVISIMLYPSIYNELATMTLLRFGLHLLLLICSWMMWESIIRGSGMETKPMKTGFAMIALGSVLLFPICIVMMISEAGVYHIPQVVDTSYCVPTDVDVRQFDFWVHSSSRFGGFVLMAAQQASFALVYSFADKLGTH